MEQFNHLIKCLGNDNFEEFVRFNIVDVQLSTKNMLHDAMCHINTTVALDIPRTYMQLSILHNSFKVASTKIHPSFSLTSNSRIRKEAIQ
jgi:hypothetical protein